MKRGVIIFLSIILVMVIGGFIYFGIELNELNNKYENTQAKESSNTEGSVKEAYQQPEITADTDYSTTKEDLLRSDIVQDLPSSAILNLKFYNFNSGEREWENSYILRKNSVEDGTANADMDIVMSSSYVKNLKSQGTCEVLTLANEEGAFYVETELSDTALAWKFKSMLKYKDCLGL